MLPFFGFHVSNQQFYVSNPQKLLFWVDFEGKKAGKIHLTLLNFFQ